MKIMFKKWQYWWPGLAMAIYALTAHADNPCIEGGPYFDYITCVTPGTLSPGYGLTPTNIVVGTGQSITRPTGINLSVTNGLERYFVHYDCTPELNNWQTNRTGHTFTLLFVPTFPSSIATAGTYTYTGQVKVTGSPCSPFTNTIGTVTVTVTNSIPQIRLGYWPFDDTNTWATSAGQLPLVATNVIGVPSWNTNAVFIGRTNSAILSYSGSETNISLAAGTVRFWFKPNWSSVGIGGTGPGGYARLIELGSNNPVLNTNSWVINSTNGWWSIFLSTNADQIVFGSSTNGHGGINVTTGISWGSNLWHQVVLTYTPTNSVFYLDGELVANGAGSLYFPNASERVSGFRVGSDTAGKNLANGTIDELETFNYPLDAVSVMTNYQWAINLDSDGDGLSNIFENEIGTNPYGINSSNGLSSTNGLMVFTPLK